MLQQPYCQYTQRLLDKLIALNDQVKEKLDLEEIKKAIWYAITYHGEQKRDSGEPFYSHPLEVALLFAEYVNLEKKEYYKDDFIITAILHDIIEDTVVTKEIIAKEFNPSIAEKVSDLTRIKFDKKISAGENVNLLFVNYQLDVLHIKLFDRLHNVQTIQALTLHSAHRILNETILYFIPLSCYLQIPQVEQQLNDLCFKYLKIKPPSKKTFSFLNNYWLTPLNFQNELSQILNQH